MNELSWPPPWVLASHARKNATRALKNEKALVVACLAGLTLCNILAVFLGTTESAGFHLPEGVAVVPYALRVVALAFTAPLALAVLRSVLNDGDGFRHLSQLVTIATGIVILGLLMFLIRLWSLVGGAAWILVLVSLLLYGSTVRLFLVLPAIAADRQCGFTEAALRSWSRTNGHGFKLTAALLLSLIPFFIVVWVPYMVVTLILARLGADFLPDVYPWVAAFMNAVAVSIVVVLSSSVAAHAYGLAEKKVNDQSVLEMRPI